MASAAAADVVERGCGKKCMGSCCLPGSALARYMYPSRTTFPPKRDYSFGNLSSCSVLVPEPDVSDSGSDDSDMERSFLDSLLLSLWDEKTCEGLFRYDVTACQTKVIPGKHGFVAQLNEGRHMKKRPTEFRMDSVLQPYDAAKFNFTKVGQNEVLFQFEAAEHEFGYGRFEEGAVVSSASPSVITINVSPIEYGHVLLVPRVLDALPQRMDAACLLMALRFASEVDNPFFRVGYNSLGAFATINHLHFQAYYLSYPFAVEQAEVVELSDALYPEDVRVSELVGYPVRGMVFSGSRSMEALASAVGYACEELQACNMPFNLFISASGSRVFLLPQCYAERQAQGMVEAELLDTQVNPAVFEISGHLVLKRKQDYDTMTQHKALRLLAAVSLSETAFECVREICVASLQRAVKPAPTDGVPVVHPAMDASIEIVLA